MKVWFSLTIKDTLNLNSNLVSLLTGDEIVYFADKVFVHRWPHDTPVWTESIKNQLDDSVNKNIDKKQITVKRKSIKIQDFEFISLKKIGISVPFFKDECRIIFEAQFGEFFAHVHVTMKSGDFLDVFNRLMSWKYSQFPDDTNA